MRMIHRLTILSLCAVFLSHCSGDKINSGTTPILHATSKLISYTSCNELLDDIQAGAIAAMEENMDSYATATYCSATNTLFYDVSVSSDTAATDFTSTNLQEAGVDEADIIKTDGTYIYVATSSGVDIFKAWPLSSFTKVTTYSVSGGVQNLFLTGHDLILITENNNSTQLAVLNMSDPSHPSLIQTKTIDGTVASSRLVNNVLHVALSSSFKGSSLQYPKLSSSTRQAACGTDSAATQAAAEIATAIETAKKANQAAIMATTISDWLLTSGDGTTSQPIDCTSFAKDGTSSENNLAGLWSLPVSDNGFGSDKIILIKGSAQQVYASTQSVYLASTDSASDMTNIHRFAIGAGVTLHQYMGSGQVMGHIDNYSLAGALQSSFSMGEQDNVFRIATTVGQVSRDGSSEVYNNVYTLDTSTGDLTPLGQVEHIADGEEIYAARFIGDQAYIVTYQKIDPLFVIDLSDPKNPKITGELEMPGFSTYLSPLDDTHLIGLGKDGEDMGTFSWYQGLKLAIFDVSNPASLSEVESLTIGSRGTDSVALTDHHAFTYDSENSLLALPLSYYTGGTGESDYGDFQYNGVHLYSVTSDGIDTVAEVQLATNECDTPRRTLFMKDDSSRGLYVLDQDHLYLIDMNKSYSIASTQALSEESAVCGYYFY